jgi:uncharacterized protein with ParB-like and HNH nuclease domain
MSSGFETPISISDAIRKIDERKFLLPALQRKFVWNTSQIETLFDSLLQGYPINSFMFWEVTDSSIKANLRFYEFLKAYRQRWGEENPSFNTINHHDFFAVIDGQQRLTSIYIGLKGTYAYKLERKHWRNDEEAMPTRYLYLNLKTPLPDENERNMKFNFLFLTADEAEEDNANSDQYDWFRITDIFKYPTLPSLISFSNSKGYHTQPFAQDTLIQLHHVIYEKKLVNYYLERSQEIDTVLDIFIRTNSGGTFLSFSDLLMSIITANWQNEDARKEIQEVVNKVFEIKDKEFQISKDFVLKTCLVLLSDNIKFSVRNFDKSNIVSFEESWPQIKKAIITGFELIADFGLSNHSLRAKNAVIPIIYFIYHKGITNEVLHPLKYKDDKQAIQKWLNISLLKGVFGGQSDTVLTRLRKVIRESLKNKQSDYDIKTTPFPLDRIKDEFASDPSKNLYMDDAFIEELLKTQKDDANCFPILSLLYPHIDFYNQDFHKDHLHPASIFYNEEFYDLVPELEWPFFEDNCNWNSILNLQLLNSYLNKAKLDKMLKEWIEENSIDLNTQIIPVDADLDIRNFRIFIERRRQLLVKRIKGLFE